MSAPGRSEMDRKLDTPIELWSSAIEEAVKDLAHFHSASVSTETGSTQDSAAAGEPGRIFTTGRQKSGRGRLGNRWLDTDEDGLAATFVVKPQAFDRLAMAAAVATATALRDQVDQEVAARIGVKWPNDVMVARGGGPPQKIAGILIETKDDRVLIGIGINVGQSAFQPEIASTAISLRQLGQPCDRLAVLLRLVRTLDKYLSASNRVIEEAYQSLDRTAGLRMRFLTPLGEVEGVVLRCDPAIGLLVKTADGIKSLPSATTRVKA